MRELELIVSNFDHGNQQMSASKSENPSSPHVILDTIKHTLQIYKENLDQTAAEVKYIDHMGHLIRSRLSECVF